MVSTVLLLLAACAGDPSVAPGPSDRPMKGTDRVRLRAILDDIHEDRCNAYYRSVDYISGLSLRVTRVVEGRFPHPFVVCAAHSGWLLRLFLFMDLRGDSIVLRMDGTVELLLV